MRPLVFALLILALSAPAVAMMAYVQTAAPVAAGADAPPTAPDTGTPGDPVIAAAGDIACDPVDPNFNLGRGTAKACRQQFTSDLLVADPALAAVLPLGDTQYEVGAPPSYMLSYEPTWGRVKGLTFPTVGNHEYLAGGAGYYAYFGAAAGDPAKGYYSFDLGAWHLISLNAQCTYVGGCSATSPQGAWLKADLEAHPAACTLAYWHQPRFSSGEHGSDKKYQDFWKILYDADADVILNGHDHDYERFAPQTPTGAADPVSGIREFVVGTGGASHYGFGTPIANSEIRNGDTFGVLKMTLHTDSYEWTFAPEAGGKFTDSGRSRCH